MLTRLVVAALAVVFGACAIGWLAMVPVGLLVVVPRRTIAWARGTPPPDPDDDPTPAEHTEVALTLGLAGTVGVAAALLYLWRLAPSIAPAYPWPCALVPAIVTGVTGGVLVRLIPAAAGFSIGPAIVAAITLGVLAAMAAVVVADYRLSAPKKTRVTFSIAAEGKVTSRPECQHQACAGRRFR